MLGGKRFCFWPNARKQEQPYKTVQPMFASGFPKTAVSGNPCNHPFLARTLAVPEVWAWLHSFGCFGFLPFYFLHFGFRFLP